MSAQPIIQQPFPRTPPIQCVIFQQIHPRLSIEVSPDKAFDYWTEHHEAKKPSLDTTFWVQIEGWNVKTFASARLIWDFKEQKEILSGIAVGAYGSVVLSNPKAEGRKLVQRYINHHWVCGLE